MIRAWAATSKPASRTVRYTRNMGKSLTFLHAADLHLGAPFRGLRSLSKAWSQRLLTAIPEAYDRVIDAALAHKVDFAVFAGDIFDSSRASYGDYRHFFGGLERLREAGIPAYLCTGNHDPYTSWQNDLFALPDNATMLPASKPGFELFLRDGEPLCLIAGRGFYSQAWPMDVDIAEGLTRDAAVAALSPQHPDVAAAPFCVGILHTGFNVDLQKAPTDPAHLLSTGMDYWALGHLHKKMVYPSLSNPRAVFSGCIQGRDIKETGERGCFIVTLSEEAAPRLEFVPTASVAWEKLEVDVSECIAVSEIPDLIMRALFRANGKAHCEEMCVRVTLIGATALHELLARPGVLEDLRHQINDGYPEFFCDALIDATRRPIDKGALLREGLFPAVLMRTARAHRGNVADEVAYLQEEFMRKGMSLPASCVKRVDDLAAEAENLVLDLLQRGEAER